MTALSTTDIEAYLAQHRRKELLRLLTCGSVDDGKSTLIGRLLFDAQLILDDQLAALERDSRTHGTTGGGFDPALLTDGLKSEREQGITIDVAYRYFATDRRKFIVADTPGHEQYTRNMATGASHCDLAVILVDARKGVVTQTRRHSFIVSLLGIRHVIVAVNKMDLVDWSEDVFQAIQDDYTGFAARLDAEDVRFIPISALNGDNVVKRSESMPWYEGSTLLHMLENVTIASDRNLIDLRLPVQYVNRPHLDFRGYCGTVASGVLRPGDRVTVLPSRRTTRVERIVTYDGDLEQAFPPHAVTVTLADEVDVARGDMLAHPANLPRVSANLEAMVVWMAEEPLTPGKRYLFKHCTRTVSGSVASIRYRIDVNTLARGEAQTLELNAIGRCEVRLAEPIPHDTYATNRGTGAFIVIDPFSNVTVGAGMIVGRATESEGPEHWETPPPSADLHASGSRVSADERAERFGQRGLTVLLTGLSGAGKTSLALELERRLFDLGRAVSVLDGETLRLGINRDLGFSEAERAEAMRRTAEMARGLNDAGLVCVCAITAPEADARERMANIVGEDRFLVVHLAAPLAVCRARHGGPLYDLAERGEIANVPGVSAPYEAPESPDLRLPTDALDVEESAARVLTLLEERGVRGEG